VTDQALLQRMLEAGRAAWPELRVDGAACLRHLADLEGAAEANAADLYLACACQQGVPGALAAFDARFAEPVRAAARGLDGSRAFVQEVEQTVRARLFVAAAGAQPKIAEYSGRGALASWVRVVALNVAQRLRSDGGRDVEAENPEELLVSPDPELAYIRDRYAMEFREAFEQALAALPARDRTVLKMYLLDGLNIGRIGALQGVHRATVARWIAAAREFLFEETRRGLHRTLKISAAEFESLLAVVRSGMDVSIRQALNGR
jgi:RNA polymerase sigma-70 factor, ECF subfamily